MVGCITTKGDGCVVVMECSHMIFSRNKLNKMVESKHPWWHLLLPWRTPLAGCSRGLHCWSFHVVPDWLEQVFLLCWSFWGPATGQPAGLCQTPSWSLWSRGTDRAETCYHPRRQVGDAEMHLISKAWILFSESGSRSCLVWPTAAIAEAILMWTFMWGYWWKADFIWS